MQTSTRFPFFLHLSLTALALLRDSFTTPPASPGDELIFGISLRGNLHCRSVILWATGSLASHVDIVHRPDYITETRLLRGTFVVTLDACLAFEGVKLEDNGLLHVTCF